MCAFGDGACGDGKSDGDSDDDTQCPVHCVYVGLGYVCPFPTGCRVTGGTVLYRLFQ